MANYTLNYTGEKVDELLNKIDTAFGETTVMGDTLTWDGDMTGKPVVSLDMGEDGVINFCKVSEAVPTIEDLSDGVTVTLPGMGTSSLPADALGNGDGYIVAEVLVFVSKPNTTVESIGLTFPETGTWVMQQSAEGMSVYVSKITIPNYTGFETTKIKALDVKYLPKAHQFGDVPIGDTLTWDGSAEGRPIIDIGDGLTFIRVSDNTPTIDDFANGYSWVHSGGSTGVVTPDEIQFDEATGVITGGSTAQDSLPLTVIPYPNFEYMGITIPDEGIYTLYFGSGASYFRTLTIPGYQFTGIKTIDPKYLPVDYIKQLIAEVTG